MIVMWVACLSLLSTVRAETSLDGAIVTVRAGEHDRPRTLVCVGVEASLATAPTAFVLHDASDASRTTVAQLTGPSLLAPGARQHELWFMLDTLPAGEERAYRVAAAAEPGPAFAWKETAPDELDLNWQGAPMLRYVHPTLDNTSPDAREQTYKPFHHVLVDGKLLTKGPGGLYTHHRGLFFGFSRVTYDGDKMADVWHCGGDAHQAHETVLAADAGSVVGRHRTRLGWHGQQGVRFAEEHRELAASAMHGGGLSIDFASRVTPTAGKVRLDGDPQHAGFHFRAANEVAEKREAETYFLRPDGAGKPGESRNWPDNPEHVNLPWNAMSFVAHGERWTVLYLDHPRNPKEARASERPYGRFGNYFEYDAAPERPLEVRYRLWIVRGELTAEQAAARSAEFVDPPQATIQLGAGS